MDITHVLGAPPNSDFEFESPSSSPAKSPKKESSKNPLFTRFITWASGSKPATEAKLLAPLTPAALSEKSAFITEFAKIRFDRTAVKELSSKPLPWPLLERSFQTSGAETLNARSREKYLEWIFSSTQDCTAWIDTIPKEITFPTQSFPLTLDEALAVKNSYRHNCLGRAELTPTEKSTIRKLIRKIDRMMKTHPSRSGSHFIRLDPRSPKDAVMYSGIRQHVWLKAQVELEVARINESDSPLSLKKHQKQATLASLAVQALSFDKGEDAVALLTHSERTYRDLTQALDFPNLWDMNIILRDFESIPYHGEFRAFVHEGKLSAISQYDHRMYFSELNEKGTSEQIQKSLTDFFYTKIASCMEGENFIIDFGITESGEIKVIELNPFEPGTGPALFSWEEELPLLQGKELSPGELPPIRVVTSHENPPPSYFPKWDEILYQDPISTAVVGPQKPAITSASK